MKDETKKNRHEAIRDAAYTILSEKGYDGASMLSIAKAAKASNETLYRWYGNKRGLFERLVRDNTIEIERILNSAITTQDAPVQTLEKFAPVFLAMILGERAILLNRAAAADPTGELGAAISAGGREVIQPLIENIIQAVARDKGGNAKQLTTWFLGLLVGDLQIKRVIGVMPLPSQKEIDERAQSALNVFFKLTKP
ncbi:TetR/AcrR family transcriptional regulator [Cochlodiniinecator piscidefendens]|uniref:TetR/AcrR family transcriptional regulator n=1 Tax=Cochlodiniinecator piscidefendens TaxID=2715756 RepID=UPI0014089F6A